MMIVIKLYGDDSDGDDDKLEESSAMDSKYYVIR